MSSKIDFIFNCVYVWLSVCGRCHRPDVGSLGTEVTIGCEPLDMGAGNRTWAPWESSTCSCLLSPFCFPLSWESLRLCVFGGPLWNKKVHPKTTQGEGSCEFAVMWKNARFWRERNWVFLPLRLFGVKNSLVAELSLSAFVFVGSKEFSCCRSREGNKRLSLLEIMWQLLQSRDNPAAWFSYFLV